MSQRIEEGSSNELSESQLDAVSGGDLNTEAGRGKNKNGSSGTGIGADGVAGNVTNGSVGYSDYAGQTGSGYDSGNFPH